MSKDTYICAECGEEYEKGWSDEEAVAECIANFGVDPSKVSGGAIVCDTCYKQTTFVE